MDETCKSCGKAWTDHLGVEPTCALLQEAVAILKEIGEPSREGIFSQRGKTVCKICGYPTDKHSKECAVKMKNKFLEKAGAYLKME